jgi:GT2 family glycosyltransferase
MTAVVTIVSGREGHLHRQRLGLAAAPPDLHVIVGMGRQPQLQEVSDSPVVASLEIPADPGGLPLASARNAGARAALDAGADVVVFLDVDCIPGSRLIARYGDAARRSAMPTLLCGPVSYLPPPPPGGYPTTGLRDLAPPHPGRPAPPDGQVLNDDRFELFWSISFAASAATWCALGGFDDEFVGYGAEDTDFALRAASAGAGLSWVGGAEAYHQHHEPAWSDPRRVSEMARNSKLFHSRHGFWPMRAWLDDLAARHLVDFDPDASRLEPTSASARLRRTSAVGDT